MKGKFRMGMGWDQETIKALKRKGLYSFFFLVLLLIHIVYTVLSFFISYIYFKFCID